MIRLLHAYFPKRTLFLGVSEACLVSLAFLSAILARGGADGAERIFSGQHGSLKILILSLGMVACMHYFDLYDTAVLSNRREVRIRLAQALGTVYSFSVLVDLLYPPLELGRGIFILGLLFAAALLFFWRRLFSKLNGASELADRVLILGAGPFADVLAGELAGRPELGVRVVGRVVPGQDPTQPEGVDLADSPRSLQVRLSSGLAPDLSCGGLSGDLSRAVKRLRATRIVVAMGDRRGKLPVDALLSLKCRGLAVQDGVELYEAVTGKVPIESVRLGWLLFSPGCHASRMHLAYKRAASIVASVAGMILSLPLVPWIILAIKLSSSGPILYRQRRTGRDGMVFDCYKFRTMRADAEAHTGPAWAQDDDPRIARAGKFLRQWRLDELPQLWNVFRGDMSLVGPRPERPEFVAMLNREIPYYNLRHTIRPGITGWAQIRYRYGNSVEDAREKLRYDLFYVKNMSAGLDFLVLLHTCKVILLGRGAK